MKAKKDHLRSQGSFQFALNMALVATLVALVITLVGQVGTTLTMASKASIQQGR